jgi:hypothetical protein
VLLEALDAWIARQDNKPSRPAGIRRILERGLAGELKSAVLYQQRRRGSRVSEALWAARRALNVVARRRSLTALTKYHIPVMF